MLVLAPTDCDLCLSPSLRDFPKGFFTLRTLNHYLYIVSIMGRVNECNGVKQLSHSLGENLQLSCVDLYRRYGE